MTNQLIPVQSDIEIAESDAEISHAPYRHAVAIDALKIVQSHRGWVSDESLKAIARHLEMSPEELDGIATFYNLIFRRPVGEKIILLCNSVTCWIKGRPTSNPSQIPLYPIPQWKVENQLKGSPIQM